ncbi:MAG TPA: ABC transporter permease [Candidatus Limnocylindria bacterium]|nr:ABC transporter permease [Candidatus Limnocylindria bacterium]
MTLLTRELRASYAFVERNFYLSKRYWGWELTFLVYSVATALAISLIGRAEGNERLLLTLVVGAIFWNYLSTVFELIGETISWERWEGTLEYTMMAPVRRYTQLLGTTFYALLYGVVQTGVVLLVVIWFFELDLSGANFAGAVLFLALGSVSFVGIGIMASILPLIYVERGSQMVYVVQATLLLISGVYYSIEILPEWMQVLARFSPATYVLDGVRQALIDGVGIGSLLHDVWPLLVMGFIFVPLGIWAFSRAERYAKRTGKLKRVG